MSFSAAFPRQGECYRSEEEWCVRILEAGAVQGTSLTFSTQPHGNTSTFRCSLTRPHSDGTDAPCTFLLSANSSPRTGTVTVDASSPEHSCLLWQRKATAEQARRGCQRALDELRGAEPPTKRKVGQTRRPLQNSSSKTALVDSDTEPSDSSSTTVAQTIYPSAASLTADVQALLALGPVLLPSVDQCFLSARVLFIHLHAYSRSAGFTLFRRGSSVKVDSTWLYCSKYRPESRSEGETQCGFAIKVKRGKGGTWRVDKVKGEHSHELSTDGSEAVEDQSEVHSPQKRRRGPPPSPTLPNPLELDTPTTSSASKLLTQQAPPPIDNPLPPRARTSQPLRHRPLATSTSALPSIPPTFSAQLPVFLLSLFPSCTTSEVADFADNLVTAGFSTFDDLADLAGMDDSVLWLMCELVQRRAGAEERREVEDCLVRVREALTTS